jgi:spermidine/putrescine transport system ATP-binding protein
VALARAIVCEPKVLLLDEPLSALDAKLRHAMQLELKRLQQRLGITFIFVTHDQDEALTMSDRIAVMNAGRIEQVDDAVCVYHNPKTSFVAGFIGQANILRAELVHRNGRLAKVRVGEGVELGVAADGIPPQAASVLISIRPEKIHLQKAPPALENVFEASVEEELFKGAIDQLLLRTRGGMELTAVVANESATQEAFHKGDRIYCHLHPDDIVVMREE